MDSLPASVRVACWVSAWLDGRASPDAVIDAVAQHAGVVAWAGDELPPALLLGRIRSAGTSACAATLPAPGDPAALAGPPSTNAAVTDAGEGVHLLGARTVLTPDGRTWAALAATPPTLPHWRDVDRQLRSVLIRTAEDLAALDVARWNPDVADALLNLRQPPDEHDDLPLPRPEVGRLMTQAARCRSIVDLALRDDGAAVSASEVRRRRTALDELERVSRLALVAATAAGVMAG